jgi:hypothetical protein
MTAFLVAWIVIAVAYLALFSTLMWILWRHRKSTPREPATPTGYRENAQASEVDEDDDEDDIMQVICAAAAQTGKPVVYHRHPGRLTYVADDSGNATPVDPPRKPRPGPSPRPISE